MTISANDPAIVTALERYYNTSCDEDAALRQHRAEVFAAIDAYCNARTAAAVRLGAAHTRLAAAKQAINDGRIADAAADMVEAQRLMALVATPERRVRGEDLQSTCNACEE